MYKNASTMLAGQLTPVQRHRSPDCSQFCTLSTLHEGYLQGQVPADHVVACHSPESWGHMPLHHLWQQEAVCGASRRRLASPAPAAQLSTLVKHVPPALLAAGSSVRCILQATCNACTRSTAVYTRGACPSITFGSEKQSAVHPTGDLQYLCQQHSCPQCLI